MSALPAYALLVFDNAYEEQPQDAVLRTDMEAGPPKQAPLQTRAMIQRPATFILKSNADYLTFRTWVITTLNMGADWFDWTDPADATLKQARIVNGYSGMRWKPTRKNFSRWLVSFQLETWG